MVSHAQGDGGARREGLLLGFSVSVLLSLFTLLWFGQQFRATDLYYFIIILTLVLVALAWIAIARIVDKRREYDRQRDRRIQ